MELHVELAFVAAVSGVGFEEVAVAGFEFLQEVLLLTTPGPQL